MGISASEFRLLSKSPMIQCRNQSGSLRISRKEFSLIPTARNSPSGIDLSSQKANVPLCNGNKSGICGRCRRYGLPRCSYTPKVPTQREVFKGTVSRNWVAAYRLARATLVDQFSTGPIYNTHSQLRIFLVGNNDIEDESDNELQEGNDEFDVE
jgi:hypothetical protein